MIRFVIKRHMDNGRSVGTSTFETLDADVQELEAALLNGGYDSAGSYDLRELVGVEILPKAVQQAQPGPVNAMLVETLQAAENLEHEALVALSEATYELKVGNIYTTATDTYKANNDLIHRLDKILNSQYRDRKRAALTAAQQAQPVCGYDDETGNCTRANCCKQAQPERAPLSDAEIEDLRGEANRGYCIDKVDYFKAFRDAEQAHGIKQGGQQ